jgi:hypothetical protein
MATAIEDSRVPLVYLPRFREFGLAVDADVIQTIEHCPWCGVRLPDSLRDRYFERLEQLGLGPESSELPLDLRSDAWWRMGEVS